MYAQLTVKSVQCRHRPGWRPAGLKGSGRLPQVLPGLKLKVAGERSRHLMVISSVDLDIEIQSEIQAPSPRPLALVVPSAAAAGT